MPIDSSGRPMPAASCSRSRSSRSRPNAARASCSDAPIGAIVIRPTSSRFTGASMLARASGARPAFDASAVTLTWSSTRRRRFSSAATRSRRWSSSTESTEWITANERITRRALLDWRRPMKCHSASGSAATFGSPSWTRLSPSRVRPASIARRATAIGRALVTATMRSRAGS